MARIEARIDGNVKEKAKDVLAIHGLTISDFMRMTLTTVANEGLPKYYSLPNQELEDSFREIVADLSGEEDLPETTSFEELEQLLDSDGGLESTPAHD